MVHLVQVATCNLNQWAMDFDLNLENVEKSIRQWTALEISSCTVQTRSQLTAGLDVSASACQVMPKLPAPASARVPSSS